MEWNDWSIPSATFVRAIVELQTKFSHSSKFSRNFRNMSKNSPCFVDHKKAYNRVPLEKLWGVLQEYSVDSQWWV